MGDLYSTAFGMKTWDGKHLCSSITSDVPLPSSVTLPYLSVYSYLLFMTLLLSPNRPLASYNTSR